ncbi:hypothetical protein, partial [Candidatus Ichthyocystis sparus]|uniref:hypothetical protein n=2 Tax=Candidatus Ichthyocystis sparus TaxID=1561004 RepID=UPI001F5F6E0A
MSGWYCCSLFLLGVTLSPGSVRVVAGLLFKVNKLAEYFYNSIVSKQLSPILSGKLSLTERA